MTEQAARTRKPRRMAREPETEAQNTPIVPKPPSKASLVECLLVRPGGASLADLCEATGWLPHTCRALLTGLRKKGRELERCRREDGTTIYRLAPLEAAA
jgi:hypothetical protein